MNFQNSDTDLDIKQLVDGYIAARSITYDQYQRLSAAVLADGTVDDAERRQINRLFDAIQVGMVKILD
ncbi:MAG: hypothetical protein AAF215_00410 [Cyanobacteria bacterium P01_A01_bin.123]